MTTASHLTELAVLCVN